MALSGLQFVIMCTYVLQWLFFLALFAAVVLKCHRFFIAVVKTHSMRPQFNRGDIVFSTPIDNDTKINLGDVVLAELAETNRVLCHRVVSIHREQYYITKGDANDRDDGWLFSSRPSGFQRHHLRGKVFGKIPYFGIPVLAVQETLWGKGILAASWVALWVASL